MSRLFSKFFCIFSKSTVSFKIYSAFYHFQHYGANSSVPVEDTQVRIFELQPLKQYKFYTDKLYLPYELYTVKKHGIEPKITITISVYVI